LELFDRVAATGDKTRKDAQ